RVGGRHQESALPQQPPPVGVLQGDALKLASAHSLDAIVQRQALVHIRIVRAQQVGDRLIVLEDASDKQLQLAAEVVDQVRQVVRKQIRIGLHQLQSVHVQPLEGEVGGQRMRPGVRQQAVHLRIQYLRTMQLPARAQLDELLVRWPAPQEEGQARGEFLVSQPELRTGLRPRWRRVVAVKKLRADQDGHQAFLNARIEPAALAALGVERERALQILARDRSPKGLFGDARKNLARARKLFRRTVRIAYEDALAAGRLADTFRHQRPLDLDVLDARTRRVAVHVVGHAGDGDEQMQDLVGLGGGLLQISDADPVRAGADVTADVLESAVDLTHADGLLH